MISASSPRWHVLMQEQEALTVCLPSVISSHCPTSATLIPQSSSRREVSDGVIAPGYTEEALEILKQKKKGNYNVIEIDPSYVPDPLEQKQVFGITFEQGRNELDMNDDLLSNIVTKKKEIPAEALRWI